MCHGTTTPVPGGHSRHLGSEGAGLRLLPIAVDREGARSQNKFPSSLLHRPEGWVHPSDDLRRVSKKAFVDLQYSERPETLESS